MDDDAGDGATNDSGDAVRVSDALRHEGAAGSWRERLREAQLWVLVDANRLVVAAALAAAVFLTIVLAVTVSPPSVTAYLLEGTAIAKGYVELQTAAVTVITIVLAINQLVLSPELGSVGRQRERLNDALENRTRAEDLADAPATPTDPVGYLRTLLATTRARAERLRAAVPDDADPALRRDVAAYADDVVAETDRIESALADEEFGSIRLLGAAMHFTTAEKIHAVREIRATHEDAFADESGGADGGAAAAAVEEMLAALELFAVAREYFRSLYVQWEFIDFTRSILYVGLPAIVVAHLSVGLIDGGAFTGAVLGYPTQLLFEALAFTVALVPVLVLISYVARLSTLAKGTVFMTPFSPEREHGHWEE